jgi:hypothetical protein
MKKKKFTRKQQKELVANGTKGCSSCGEIFPLDRFGKQNTKLGYRSYCRYCKHVYDAKKDRKVLLTKEDFWHKHEVRDDNFTDENGKIRNKERDRVNWIKRVYNADFEEALRLYKDTYSGNCEICNKTAEENGKLLAVDHCHAIGIIRGVLCSRCNTGLGMFQDRIDILENAISYLNRTYKKEGH